MGLLVRLPFHDAATFDRDVVSEAIGGSDGCVDMESLENKGLQEAVDILEPIRRERGSYTDDDGNSVAIMSRGDVWALAGNVMIESAGGPKLQYKVGRVDASNCTRGRASVSRELGIDVVGRRRRSLRESIGIHSPRGRRIDRRARPGKGQRESLRVRRSVGSKERRVHQRVLRRPAPRALDEAHGGGGTVRGAHDVGAIREHGIDGRDHAPDGRRPRVPDYRGVLLLHGRGDYTRGLSCPNATHGFAEHVWDFAEDEGEWRDEFAGAWAKLTSMTKRELRCVTEDCSTPSEKSSATALLSSFYVKSYCLSGGLLFVGMTLFHLQ